MSLNIGRKNLGREVVGMARLNEEYSCGKHQFNKTSVKPHIGVCKRRDKKRIRRLTRRLYQEEVDNKEVEI